MSKPLIDGNDYLDPTSDYVFKALLKPDTSRDYLCDLISNITGIDKNLLLKELKFDSEEMEKDVSSEKAQRMDILCDIKDTKINLEMNQKLTTELVIKNNLYVNKLHGRMTTTGEKYINNLIIQINFDNYQRFKSDDSLISKSMMVNLKTQEVEDENIIIYHVNLLKAEEMWYHSDKKNRFINELMILKIRKKSDAQKIIGDDKSMAKVVERLEELTSDDKLVMTYNAEKLEQQTHERELKEATEKGLSDGLAKGISQGISQEKLEIAKKMLEAKESISKIIKYTGFTEKDIKKLSKEVL